MKLIRKFTNLALFGLIASFLFTIFASSIGVVTIEEMKMISLDLGIAGIFVFIISTLTKYIEVNKS